MGRLLQRLQKRVRRLRLQPVRFGNDRDLPSSTRRAHLQRMLEGADLLRHDPSRLRLWFGQEDLPRACAEDVIGIASMNECRHTCRESAFTTSGSARYEIGVAEPVVFVGAAQKFKRRLWRKSH